MTGFEVSALGCLQRIAAALERLADQGDQVLEPEEPEEPAEAVGCAHPQENRISLGGFGATEEWQCRACGYRTPEPVVEGEA